MTSPKKADTVHQQLHNFPFEVISLPARIDVVGFMRSRELTASDIKSYFAGVVERSGFKEDDIVWLPDGGYISSAHGGRHSIAKMSIAATHYTLEIWSPEADVSGELMPLKSGPDGVQELTNLQIFVLESSLAPEDVAGRLTPGAEIMASRTHDDLCVATTYEPDAQGVETYVVYPAKGSPSGRQMAQVVSAIIETENSFHLLLRPQEAYLEAGERLTALDADSTGQIVRVNASIARATTAELRSWLSEITSSVAELAALSEDIGKRFREAVAQKDALRAALRALGSRPVASFAKLDEPLMRVAAVTAANYAALMNRVASARQARSDAIALLQTKIDLIQRDQSFALQCSMHRTTQAQMAMQQSIEGLYIFIVAFYLTELARLIFESLHERHLLAYSPNTLAALFIPIALVAGFVLSGKAGHMLEGRRRRRMARKKSMEPESEFAIAACDNMEQRSVLTHD